MFKRNQVIIIAAQEREYTQPRLAIIKSVRKDGRINCTFYMYKDSNIATDYLVSQDKVIAVTNIDANDFRSLACDFGNKDPKDPFIIKQKALDSRYPQYALMRKDYGPKETIEEGIARLRRERALAAA